MQANSEPYLSVTINLNTDAEVRRHRFYSLEDSTGLFTTRSNKLDFNFRIICHYYNLFFPPIGIVLSISCVFARANMQPSDATTVFIYAAAN